MKNWKTPYIAALCLACTLSLSSCHRTSREVWEDTKTCSRYMERGWRSLLGHHIDGREYVPYDCAWDEEEQTYVPLAQTGDLQRLPTFHELGSALPPPKESPGDPDSSIPGIESFSSPMGHLAKVFQSIHFDTDHYSIQGPENVQKLSQVASFLTKNPRMTVFVEGHADERGAAAYNLALGSRRANAIRAFLIQNGAHPDQLFTVSYGKERPLVSSHDDTAWQQNRRGQFKLYER